MESNMKESANNMEVDEEQQWSPDEWLVLDEAIEVIEAINEVQDATETISDTTVASVVTGIVTDVVASVVTGVVTDVVTDVVTGIATDDNDHNDTKGTEGTEFTSNNIIHDTLEILDPPMIDEIALAEYPRLRETHEAHASERRLTRKQRRKRNRRAFKNPQS